MTNLSDVLVSGRPKRITIYTSGTGTHTYLPSATRVRKTLSGGGSGGVRNAAGGTLAACGGPAAASVSVLMVITSATETYTVGAAGVGATANSTAGTAGGRSRLGTLVAEGAPAPIMTSSGQVGAVAGNAVTSGLIGVAGGASGGAPTNAAGDAGSAPNFSAIGTKNGSAAGGTFGGTNNGGGGGGGDSLYGGGGAGGNGAAASGAVGLPGANATGYGAGGGGGGYGTTTTGNGGNGSPGVVIIEEY